MAFVKFCSPTDWGDNLLLDRPMAVEVPVSSRGLIGNDRTDFLKVASHQIVDVLDRIKVARDEVPIHLIALGAREAYGYNRNGDGFTEKECQDCHGRFVKHAKWFRNHRNKPAQGHPFYGYVKASAYNNAMRRVELLAMLNAEKSAADRNGGLVATESLEKLARTGEIPVSMACRIPHDVCSFCHNRATKRAEYCTADTCEAGGCKDNLAKMVKLANGDVHHLGVDNPNPLFFDISDVFRPADRVAYGAKPDEFMKAAAAEYADGLADYALGAPVAPLEIILAQDGSASPEEVATEARLKLAQALYLTEQQEAHSVDPVTQLGFGTSRIDTEAFGPVGSAKCAAALGALADRKVILPVEDFARLYGEEKLASWASAYLPTIYSRMKTEGSLEHAVAADVVPVGGRADADQRLMAIKAASDHSLDREEFRTRVVRRTLNPPESANVKTSFENHPATEPGTAAEQLAKKYAVYKVAALTKMACDDDDFALTVHLACQQNRQLA